MAQETPKSVQENPREAKSGLREAQETSKTVKETQSSFSAVPLRVLMKGAEDFLFWLSVASLFRVPFLEPFFYSFGTNFGGNFRCVFAFFSLLGVTWSKQRF